MAYFHDELHIDRLDSVIEVTFCDTSVGHFPNRNE
ncbi:hypothetical protein T4A_4730 [Trichinella pseudospiralis]|uniref:Uncharacterized protein n=1 Tax=Trichinella pseudospiralis TaxID=6337 RepID=A0A0V1DQ99_TRIPS|nr:hypothetical protein T4A_4730 [Trichinella pseudospiralis]